MPLPEVCVVYLLRPGASGSEVLLGEKRKGLGLGKVVAPGGKLEPGETPAAAAVREVLEEVGIAIAESDLEAAGCIDYYFPTKPEWSQRSWVFRARGSWGEAAGSEELIARWLPVDEVPLDRMWDDAKRWLPGVLAGGTVEASFDFGSDLSTVVEA